MTQTAWVTSLPRFFHWAWPGICLTAWLVACTPTVEVIPLSPIQPGTGRLSTLDAPGTDDPADNTGWWPSVAFDSHDQPHVAFCDVFHGDVRYARQDAAGTWRVQSVVSKGAVGKYIALAVSPAGPGEHVGIAYYDQDHTRLHYTWQDGANHWSDEKVAWGREVGMGAALVFDAHATPHIVYYQGNGKLAHAQRLGPDTWQTEVLATAMGAYSVRLGAAFLPDGLWVSYVDWKMHDAALYLGHLVGQEFSTEAVATRQGPGWHSQLIFADAATATAPSMAARIEPSIVHSAKLTAETHVSRRGKDGVWHEATLFAHANTFAATTYRGDMVVAFQDLGDRRAGSTLAYARQQAGAWQVRQVDADGPVGGHVSLAISKSGRLLIVYYADVSRSVKIYDEVLGSVSAAQ